MVSDENSAESPESQPRRRDPISPAKRKRLQGAFEHASKQMAQEAYDYACELFEQCVLGDPSNLIYAQNYVGNLQRKYGNNKTGKTLAQLKELGARKATRKALAKSEWDEVIKHGLKVLTVNPWDVASLTAMATASENSGDDEVELFYLKCALDANPKDPNVNRQCAQALATREQFDQAIACWHRVEQARPDDDEAPREIARLAVEKTIVKGGYDEDGTKKGAPEEEDQPGQPKRKLSMEERLEQTIDQDPHELSNYYELAQLHINNEDYERAEEVFARALEASGGDVDVRERWEDTQLRHLRQQMNRTEDEQTREKLRKELIEKGVIFYKNRCDRYPHNLAFRYDLGYRYQLNGQYNEAIKEYQQARNDSRRQGVSLLRLGQCFEKVKHHRLAMTHYEEAIAEIPDREDEHKKDALYRAGRLSMALKDLETAEKHLTSLAGRDFGYRDVSDLLDKISKLRENT